ncbi:hypothetical protein [Streptomyces sp. NBC_00659]|uniref:hypothetical protein n=1 Tax=Streptomyces sp. NBC_00659 TaxID=2903669 RepID=UPI003FCCCF41
MVGTIRVRRVLESLPGIGAIRVGRLLADLGTSEGRRVQGAVHTDRSVRPGRGSGGRCVGAGVGSEVPSTGDSRC